MNLLKKHFLPIIIFVIIFACFVVEFGAMPANAASCRISFSDPSCIVGNTVTVNVSVTGEIAAADITVVYSTDYLEFVSVSGELSSGGNGSVRLYNMYNSGTGNMSFTMTFKARVAGSSVITVANYDIVDGDGEPMDVTCGTSTVTITNLSSDSSLSSLSISPGSLSPAFSSGTRNYSLSVSNSVTKITVTATPADSQARVTSITGNSDLKVGSNTITVTVTAGDGSTTNYYITVTRAEAPYTPPADKPNNNDSSSISSSSKEEITLYAKFEDGTELEIGEFNDSDIPAGFETINFDYKGTEIAAISHDGQSGVAFYLLGNDTNPTGFYFYNESKDIVYPMPVFSSDSRYTLVDFPTDLKLPKNYSLSSRKIGNTEISVLVPDDVESENHYLLCAINSEGIKNIYIYDVEENTLQRYDFAVKSEADSSDDVSAITPDDTSDTPNEPENPDDGKTNLSPIFAFLPDFLTDSNILLYALLGSLLLILVLAVLFVTSLCKNNRLKKMFNLMATNNAPASNENQCDSSHLDYMEDKIDEEMLLAADPAKSIEDTLAAIMATEIDLEIDPEELSIEAILKAEKANRESDSTAYNAVAQDDETASININKRQQTPTNAE